MLLGELSFLQKEMVYSGKVAGALSLDTEVKGVLLKQEKSLPLSYRGAQCQRRCRASSGRHRTRRVLCLYLYKVEGARSSVWVRSRSLSLFGAVTGKELLFVTTNRQVPLYTTLHSPASGPWKCKISNNRAFSCKLFLWEFLQLVCIGCRSFYLSITIDMHLPVQAGTPAEPCDVWHVLFLSLSMKPPTVCPP